MCARAYVCAHVYELSSRERWERWEQAINMRVPGSQHVPNLAPGWERFKTEYI